MVFSYIALCGFPQKTKLNEISVLSLIQINRYSSVSRRSLSREVYRLLIEGDNARDALVPAGLTDEVGLVIFPAVDGAKVAAMKTPAHQPRCPGPIDDTGKQRGAPESGAVWLRA
jgi:hypothetical protein